MTQMLEQPDTPRGPKHMEIRRFQETIKKMMFGRGYHYEDLAKALEISLSTAKRLLSSDDLSFERVLQICNWLDIDFYKVVEMTKQTKIEWQYLSREQEEFLAANPGHYRILKLLLRGESPAALRKRLSLAHSKMAAFLADLETYALISVKQMDAEFFVKPLVAQRFDWIDQGPLWRAFFKQSVTGFIDKYFAPDRTEKDRHIEYGQRQLSSASYKKFKLEIEDLYKKYAAISEFEVETISKARLVPMTCVILIDKFWNDWLDQIYVAPEVQD